jgi:malate synthase
MVGNVSAALRYTLAGGDKELEDAAVAEITRAQMWQWIRYPKGVFDDGRKVTLELFRDILA